MTSTEAKLVIDLGYSWFHAIFLMYFARPTVSIDGVDVGGSGWGTRTIMLRPGTYKVDAWLAPSAVTTMEARAQVTVQVSGGETRYLSYRPGMMGLWGTLTAA